MPRSPIRLALAASLVALGAACATQERGDADTALGTTTAPAGDTGVTAPASPAGVAVDTAGDSITTQGALQSTDQPIQPPAPPRDTTRP